MTMPTLVIGEALIDIVHRVDGSTNEHVGGSPANVAFGLGRLGHATTLAPWIGADARGDAIRDRCVASSVSLLPSAREASHTSTAIAKLDETGAASYIFDIESRVPEVPTDLIYGHVHTGSIAAVLEPSGTQVRQVLASARGSATVSYDPNARPTLMGDPAEVVTVVEERVALSDVVKASDEDAAWLYPGRSLEDVALRWHELGASLVVITAGAEGALASLAGANPMRVLAAKTTVVDTVGAGDSFMSGLLSGLIDAGLLGSPAARERLANAGFEDIAPAISRALATAAVTVSKAGAYAPMRIELTL